MPWQRVAAVQRSDEIYQLVWSCRANCTSPKFPRQNRLAQLISGEANPHGKPTVILALVFSFARHASPKQMDQMDAFHSALSV